VTVGRASRLRRQFARPRCSYDSREDRGVNVYLTLVPYQSTVLHSSNNCCGEVMASRDATAHLPLQLRRPGMRRERVVSYASLHACRQSGSLHRTGR